MATSQFTIYRSTDSAAPTVSGTAGDLVNLLDKCLVAGYGSKSAAGWTKPYTGTNKAAFKQGTGSAGMYLRVQDDAPATAKEARITGYESMSDVDTGTNPFPTAAQGVGGVAMLVARKSTSADATTRSWIVVADAKTCYVFIQTGDASPRYFAFAFGDIYSFLSNDSYRCMIMGRVAENNATTGQEGFDLSSNQYGTAVQGNYIARSYTAIGTSLQFTKHGNYIWQAVINAFTGNMAYPNSCDSSIYLSRISVEEPSAAVYRGWLRGIWHWLHVSSSVNDGDTFNGSGDLAGRSFVLVKSVGTGPSTFAIETSNTVESN